MKQIVNEEELVGKIIKEVIISDDAIVIHLENDEFMNIDVSENEGSPYISTYNRFNLNTENYWAASVLFGKKLIPKERWDEIKVKFEQQQQEITKQKELEQLAQLKKKYE